MDLEKQIRRLVANGSCKAEVARFIGVSVPKLTLICEHIEGLTWKPNKPNGLGRRPEEALPRLAANLAKARAKRKDNLTRTVRGVTGTVQDLCAHFKTAVTYSTVNRRVAAGMDLEKAMFLPPQSKGSVKTKKTWKKKPWVKYGYVRPRAGLVIEHRA
jgi:hypothetical protein